MTDFIPEERIHDPADMGAIERDRVGKPGPCRIEETEWTRLKSLTRGGDGIRAFSSPPRSWRDPAGRGPCR